MRQREMPVCQPHTNPEIVLVMSSTVYDRSNEPDSQRNYHFLLNVKQALVNTNISITLIHNYGNYHDYYYSWCRAMPLCSMIACRKSDSIEVFAKMLEHKPCAKDFVLIESTVYVDRFAMKRLEQVHPKNVTCLVASPTHACPSLALRGPRFFFEFAVRHQENSWQKNAVILGLLEQSRAVVAGRMRVV